MSGGTGLVEAAGRGAAWGVPGAGAMLTFNLPVRHHAVRFAAGETRFDDIALPRDLRGAVPRRQLHFRAGRFCAREALRSLGVADWAGALPRGTAGCPVWPEGVVGSITHTQGHGAAAVARRTDLLALGLDTECLVRWTRARELEPGVACAREIEQARAAGCERGEAFTLLFSAKESVFKCLYPLVGRRFGFHDVRVEAVDAQARRFHVRLVHALSERFAADTMLEGRFEIDPVFVHTAVALPAKA